MVLVQDGTRYHVRGVIQLVPGPAPWPWLAAGLAVAASLGVLARRRPGAVLALAVAASLVHAAAVLAARSPEGPRLTLRGGYLPQLACWTLGLPAVLLLLRGRRDGVLLGLLAASGLLLLGITRDATVLWSSTAVVAVSLWLDRVLVVLALAAAAAALAVLLAHTIRSRRLVPQPT